ncbi:branched-chain amino acid ABC transporter permease [Natrinema salsiterrestre]|uniref:Branched-chain amino acid ABC transporter permease n=1 Tax=Natrinema salsiterrestre TaxID=2950540 RepID=A0A9Q4L3V8_9EURY|nr:branched-chain amino acid ABC transporter permease [Natrinema salsiterrestre]MDF9747831.1 branched-chain amino acid ABC transporter permease [Natrinema salsiterrestre]
MSNEYDRSGEPVVQRFTREFLGEPNRYQIASAGVALLALLTVPFWAGQYLYVFALASIWAIFAMGWDIISGHTNYISFGHSALSGGAAYTTGVLVHNVNPDMAMYITFPLSILAAIVIGLLFAVPTLRLEGPYFSLITLLGVLVLTQLVYIYGEYTGGELGITAVSTLTYNLTNLYYYTLIPMLLIGAVLVVVSQSNIGRILRAIGENEAAIESSGIDTTRFKLWAFLMSAITMGIGGAMLAHFYGNITPSTVLVVDRSLEMVAIAVIGGMGTIAGPIGGAFVFIILRDEVLTVFGSTGRWLALWLIVLFFLVFLRDGIFPFIWSRIGSIGGGRDE